MDLLLATRNPHKTQEFRQLLGDSFGIKDVGGNPEIPVPKETGSTFKENAILKAVTISKHTDELVIADDSGLEVDALNGAPGIYSEARLSPDERRLVLTRINPETGTSDLWILELSTGILSRLTSHASEDAQWSRSASSILTLRAKTLASTPATCTC